VRSVGSVSTLLLVIARTALVDVSHHAACLDRYLLRYPSSSSAGHTFLCALCHETPASHYGGMCLSLESLAAGSQHKQALGRRS